MKYRVIKDSEEITVILEDGGIACIREAYELDEGDGRQSTTDYYQNRFDDETLESGELWETIGEGKMYYNDWTTPYDDPKHIWDALNWLCVGCEFELDESIWPNFGGG